MDSIELRRSVGDETDYGTPRRPGAATVELTIDDRRVCVPAGTSVMRAAIEAGIQVPKLCATDSQTEFCPTFNRSVRAILSR